MLDGVMRQADLLERINALGRTRRLIGPVARAVPGATPPIRYFYERVEHAEQLDLAFTYCTYSPKPYLFPPVETLFQFERRKNSFVATPRIEAAPTALVGVHPCDLHAIELLDHVFGQAPRDEHYLARRRETFLVGIDCPHPCTDGVFCKSMDCHAAEHGFDVMLYPLAPSQEDGAGTWAVVIGTEAGRAWLAAGDAESALRPASVADEARFERYRAEKEQAFPDALVTPGDELPALLDRSYDSLLWQATAQRCYSCGSCNLVCPTCYCFDMKDECAVDSASGRRIRTWDGCHLPDFALVAGGHNFRGKPAERLRHRIYRKAKWIRERTGLPGCVGCARCDRACTAKISSVEIFNQLAEEA